MLALQPTAAFLGERARAQSTPCPWGSTWPSARRSAALPINLGRVSAELMGFRGSSSTFSLRIVRFHEPPADFSFQEKLFLQSCTLFPSRHRRSSSRACSPVLLQLIPPSCIHVLQSTLSDVSGGGPSSWFVPTALRCPHDSGDQLKWRTYWRYAAGALLHHTAGNQLLYNSCF